MFGQEPLKDFKDKKFGLWHSVWNNRFDLHTKMGHGPSPILLWIFSTLRLLSEMFIGEVQNDVILFWAIIDPPTSLRMYLGPSFRQWSKFGQYLKNQSEFSLNFIKKSVFYNF